MFIYQVITWLLIFNMDSALCSSTTEINWASLFEYSSTHAASQASNSLEYLSSSLDSINNEDVSHQPTSTLPFESLPSTEGTQQWSVMTEVTYETRNSVNHTMVTTLSEQTTITKGILESSQTGTLVESMSTTTESSESAKSSLGLIESPTSLVEPSSISFWPSSTVVERTPSPAESQSDLFTSPSTVVESSTHIDEPSSTVVESSTHIDEPSSTVVERTPSPAESQSDLFTSPSTVVESSTHIDEPSSTVVESSTHIDEPSSTVVESSTHIDEPSSTVAESSTPLVEPSSAIVEVQISESGITMSNYFTDLSESTYSLQSDELVTVSDISLADLISPSMQPSSDYTYSFVPPTDIDNNTMSHSSFGYFTSLETTMSSASITETSTEFDLSISSQLSEMASATVFTLTAEGLESSTLSGHETTTNLFTIPDSSLGYPSLTLSTASGYETATNLFTIPDSSLGYPSLTLSTASGYETATNLFTIPDSSLGYPSLTLSTASGYETATNLFTIPDSSLGYPSLTLSTASAFDTITVSTNRLQFTDSITSPYTTTLIKTTEPGVETFTTHLAASVTPTTKTTGSDVTSTTPGGTESSTPAESLPIKSSSGLSTGSKIAIGIMIPLAVIGLIILGVYFYRRYNWTRGNFKNFLQPGVHYRAYTNETFNDDDVSLGGSWRKVSDS